MPEIQPVVDDNINTKTEQNVPEGYHEMAQEEPGPRTQRHPVEMDAAQVGELEGEGGGRAEMGVGHDDR